MLLHGTQTALLVASASILFPFIARLALSPITLVLLSPVLLLLLFLAYLASNVALAYALDAFRAPYVTHTSPLKAARPFKFATPAAWEAVLTRSQWSSSDSPHSLPPLRPDYPSLSAGLNEVIILIVRDFVLVWYKSLSPSPSFPHSVSSTIHASLESLLSRLESVDLAALIVRRIIPKVTAHIEQFRQSEMALRGAGLERHLTQSDELDLLLANRYAGKGGRLHPAVDNLSSMMTKQTEEAHIRRVIDKVLPLILPSKEAESNAVRVVVREILSCAVLFPVMEMLADPDFWNRAIDEVAGAAIRQQKMISRVRNILESESTTPSLPSIRTRTEDITSRTGARHFESFLRSISRCDSLLDARRLKNDVVGEIRRTRVLLANHEKEEWINGEKTEDVVAYLDRLYTAKRKVEKRITVLGGEDSDSRQSVYQEASGGSSFTLRDILTNPSSLSYFMEFMDRKNKALSVQFWLTVETFKNPLESVESGSEEDDEDLIGAALPASATVKEDLAMIYEVYLSHPASASKLAVISPKHINVIRSFVLQETEPSPAQQKKARRSVLLAQRQVEQDLEHYFEDFERSELWFRAVADLEPRSSKSAVNPTLALQSTPPSLKTLKSSPAAGSVVQGPSIRPAESAKTGLHPKFLLPSGILRRAETSPTASSRALPPLNENSSSEAATAPSRNAVVPPPMPRLPSNLEFLISSPNADSDEIRAPLFDDPTDPEPSAEEAQVQRIEAIQAALTDIIQDEKRYSERPLSVASASSDRGLTESLRSEDFPRRRGRGMFDDVEDPNPDLVEDADTGEGPPQGAFQPAAPGDLQLSYDITRLGDKITKLQSQETILDALMRKAELTGDAQELRLLNKSKSAMARELRELTFQKAQYEQQEAENRLVPDRTKVSIQNSATSEEEGKQVVRYLVEVQQHAADGSFASGWVVARRYNDFFTMHQRLRERYVAVRNLDFPGKRLVTSMSNSFLDSRRVALEKYMQSLIAIPLVCESEELRSFLSRQSPLGPVNESPKATVAFPGQSIVRNMYRSVTESIDDMFFGPSMLDVMIQRLSRQAAEFAGIVGSGVHDEDLIAQALKSSGKAAPEDTLMQLPGDLKPLEGETSTSTFSAPICDLVLAVFELDKKNNWLRRQAIVIILQQVLGGTIERKLRDVVKSTLDEGHLLSFLSMFRNNLWPGGQLKPPGVPRTSEEKARTREEANRKLSALMPDLAANMIGRSNARRGARRMFAVLQNRRLNQHIIYTVVDEIFTSLFPEMSL